MPKINPLTEADRRQKDFRALVKYYQTLREITTEKLASGMGISTPSLYRKLKKLDTLTVIDLLMLQRQLRIPREELWETLGERHGA